MQTTTLAILLEEMNRKKDISNQETGFKVKAIDGAIRRLRRKTVFPWMIKKGSLRVFRDVKEYPVASDHDEILYLDRTNLNSYADAARFHNTSLKQFYEDVMSFRNLMAEIWDEGTPMIGVDYKDQALSNINLDNAEDADDYAASDDADSVAEDNVNFKEGNGSIKIVITNSAGINTVKNTFKVALDDSNYKSKYHFRWRYLDNIPDSIEMRLQTDDNNYLKTVVTTQFAGQAFKADQWNLIAQDLNEATEVGSFDSGNIAGDKIIVNGEATGVDYQDAADLRQWKLFDYWYYSRNTVLSSGASSPDEEQFYRSSDYDTNDSLVGDKEWMDVVLIDAMESIMAELDNPTLFSWLMRRKTDVWNDFFAKYPDMVPAITTNKYRFENEPITRNLHDRFIR